MGGSLFWGGVVIFVFTALSRHITGIDFNSAEMAEGYGYAIGVMVMGIGMRKARKGE